MQEEKLGHSANHRTKTKKDPVLSPSMGKDRVLMAVHSLLVLAHPFQERFEVGVVLFLQGGEVGAVPVVFALR